MNKDDEKRKLVLQINYNKLLAYVAAAVVSFFALFQIGDAMFLPDILRIISSTIIFMGTVLFTFVALHNFKEILKIENKLKLSELEEIEPSKFFSVHKEGEISISKFLYLIIIGFLLASVFVYISIL